jgi:hypothetical protein
MPSITIPRRFRGPPDSGNGGYVCGRLAAFIEGPAVVRLRVPPPLDTAMDVVQQDDGVQMVHGAAVIATARPGKVDLEVPPAPGYDDAVAASRAYAGFRTHPFPGCFVCGPERGAGDGLRIFAGKVPDRSLVASPWVPDASLGDEHGRVRPEFLWAALDCPGAFSFKVAPDAAMVLGELTGSLTGSLRIGERCIAAGWELGHEGRKHHVGTALYSETGECRGFGRATWFEIPPTGERS